MDELEALLEEMASPKPDVNGVIKPMTIPQPLAPILPSISAAAPLLQQTKDITKSATPPKVDPIPSKDEENSTVSEQPPAKTGFFSLFSKSTPAPENLVTTTTQSSTDMDPNFTFGAAAGTPIVATGPYTKRGPPTPRLRTSNMSIDSGYSAPSYSSKASRSSRSSTSSSNSGYGSDRYSSPTERVSGPGIVTESKILMVQRQSEQMAAEKSRMEMERWKMLEAERLYEEEEKKFVAEEEQMRLYLQSVRQEQEDREMEAELARKEAQSVMEREKIRLQEEIAKLEIEKVKIEVQRVEAERLEAVRVAEEKRRIEAEKIERIRAEEERVRLDNEKRIERERMEASRIEEENLRRAERQRAEAAQREEQKRMAEEREKALRIADEEAKAEKDELDAKIAAYEKRALDESQFKELDRGDGIAEKQTMIGRLRKASNATATESEYEDDLGSEYDDELNDYLANDDNISTTGDVDDTFSENQRRTQEEQLATANRIRADREAQELAAEREAQRLEMEREAQDRSERNRQWKEEEMRLQKEAAEAARQQQLQAQEAEAELQRQAQVAMEAAAVQEREELEEQLRAEREEEEREEAERLDRIARRRAKELKLRQEEEEEAERERQQKVQTQQRQPEPQEEESGDESEEEPITTEQKIAKAERDIQKAFENMAREKKGGGTLALLQKSNTNARRPGSPRVTQRPAQFPRSNTAFASQQGVGGGGSSRESIGLARNATVAGRPSIKGGLPQGPRGGLPGGPRPRRVPT